MNDHIGVWPTDRGEPTPDSGVGVDTLALRGPTTGALAQELRQQRLQRDCNRTTGEVHDKYLQSYEFIPVGLTEARLATRVRGDQVALDVELSLPQLAWGHNCRPLSLQMLPMAADAVLSYLGDELPAVPALHEVRVTRIDLTRDFHGLRDPAGVLRMLSGRDAATGTKHVFHDGPDGRVQTVAVGSGSRWTVRAYDKQRELENRARFGSGVERREFSRAWAVASAGQLRCEAQLRTPVQTELGLFTIGDCSPDRLNQAAMTYFAKPGWDQPYGGTRVQDTLRLLQDELSAASYRNLVLLVLARSTGVPHGLTRHQFEAARALARRHRLLEDTDGGSTWQLDFPSGREVLLQESGA